MATRHVDLTGQRFTRLTVLRRAPMRGATRNAVWECQCDCGNMTVVHGFALREGRTQSCGCYNIQKTVERFTKHGQHRSKLYKVWTAMKQRCENTQDPAYKNYGGRGITVHESFRQSFEAFASELGQKPPGRQTIERIDNNKGYEPGNIRWATHNEQMRNTRVNRMITFRGETLCLMDWALRLGITSPNLDWRLKHWPIERALTEKH